MNLFNRKKYFIVFYKGDENIGCASAATRTFLNYRLFREKVASEIENETEDSIIITGIFRLTKKEYERFNK
jgi:hypothetical protein